MKSLGKNNTHNHGSCPASCPLEQRPRKILGQCNSPPSRKLFCIASLAGHLQQHSDSDLTLHPCWKQTHSVGAVTLKSPRAQALLTSQHRSCTLINLHHLQMQNVHPCTGALDKMHLSHQTQTCSSTPSLSPRTESRGLANEQQPDGHLLMFSIHSPVIARPLLPHSADTHQFCSPGTPTLPSPAPAHFSCFPSVTAQTMPPLWVLPHAWWKTY